MGAGTGDDAAVWRLTDERALVATVDVITPVVDDARTWGRVAATNAVSDVYAMGGTPLFALTVVGWPRDALPLDLLGDVLLGVQDVAQAAGFVIAGGHSIDDPEPKLGLAVTGEVHPGRMLTNAGMRPGDALVLTKALGVGIATTAIKRGVASPALAQLAVASMTRLNAEAARLAVAAGAVAATDITGFGLLGHLGRMALESGVDVRIHAGAVPLLSPEVIDLARSGVLPGGSRRNLASVADRLDVADAVGELGALVLADAQTSGGLLVALPPHEAERTAAALRSSGHQAAVVGEVTGAGSGRLTVTAGGAGSR